MLLHRVLALALLPACAAQRTAAPDVAPPAPVAAADLPADLVATPIPVAYHDVGELAAVLRDILAVRPDRGDVRFILDDRRTSTLLIFATPAGVETVRRVLGPTVAERVAAR